MEQLEEDRRTLGKAPRVTVVFSSTPPIALLRRFAKKHRLKAGLAEVVVGGQCLDQAALLHNNEGEGIGQAPILVVPGSVQLHCRIDKIGAERYDLNMCVTVTSVVPRRRDAPCGRVRECIHPFPENGLSGQYASCLLYTSRCV